MVAVIVSVGDAGALGIVANGGEWGGKEQGEDSPGSGFNLGIRAAKADKRVSKPGLGAFFHTGIAGVGFAFGINRGFDVVEGKEGVIVQTIGVVNAVHCEVDIAGVGDGNGGVGDGLEASEFLFLRLEICVSRALGWEVGPALQEDSRRRCATVQTSSRLRSEMTAGYKGFTLPPWAVMSWARRVRMRAELYCQEVA